MHARKKKYRGGHNGGALKNIVVCSLVIFFSAFVVIPIIVVFIGSFHQWNPLKGEFSFLGLDNWKKVFGSDLFWLSMGNTVIFAAIATSFRVVLGLALSSALYSKLIKYKSLYRILYYLPTITPLVAVTFVWKFIFDPQIGLLDKLLQTNINWLFDSKYAMIAILILTIWKDFGYAVIIFLGGLYSLPRDCYEAAEVDGANSMQRFRWVTLPLLKPTVLFIVITSLISYFQTYIPVMVLTQGGPGTATYLSSYLIFDEAFTKYNFGYASALSFVLFVFIAIMTGISFKVSGSTQTE
ncbi:MAG TPA: sugar ABC transporter permease [Clostridiales bacterium]|jgi:multiple sugar transport system permease protein|nr:sugar ABC transporter permease [Clostridiales bacterium]